jgi:hypothetical protein
MSKCSSRDWQSLQLTASKHGCKGKTGISIICKCGEVIRLASGIFQTSKTIMRTVILFHHHH